MKKNNPDGPVRDLPIAQAGPDPFNHRQKPLPEILRYHAHSQRRNRKTFLTVGFVLILVISVIAILLLSH